LSIPGQQNSSRRENLVRKFLPSRLEGNENGGSAEKRSARVAGRAGLVTNDHHDRNSDCEAKAKYSNNQRDPLIDARVGLEDVVAPVADIHAAAGARKQVGPDSTQ
jgi:hypothetical protein